MKTWSNIARLGRWLLATLAAVVACAVLFQVPAGGGQGRAPAMVLHLDGVIGPATADYLSRGLKRAEEHGAPILIVRMDTPGGLDTSMRAMIRNILASPVPVATWVSPSGGRAASAGTFILYASHIAAMAPGTNVGAATPVQIGGVPSMPDERPDKDKDAAPKQGSAMDAKAINDAVGYIRSLAELRGRNADWAEKAVREAASLSAAAALKEGVIDVEAASVEDLLARVDGRSVTAAGRRITLATRGLGIEEFRPDWRTDLLSTITNPNVALILMMVGIYGLIFEFMNPGAIYPGTVGTICLLIGLYALAALPVNFAGLALIALGIGLMIAEVHTPTLGLLGVAGVVSLVIGAAILVDADLPDFRVSWAAIAGVAVASAGFVMIVARLAFGTQRRSVVSGREEMIGASGVVEDWSRGGGYVFAHGERWKAAGAPRLHKGQAVRVTAVRGLTLEVEPEPEPERPDDGG